ncbi:MAG TPA: nitroreductase family protein [Alphaproteobacteria bacterium]|nr:nitroreductase family protein [Alphaproteobacteria bacterium]
MNGQFELAPRLAEQTPEQAAASAQQFLEVMRSRRTIRDFRPDPISLEAVERAIETAGLAPNGANRQPWHFVIVTDAGVKRAIREAAEEEERAFYGGRAPQEWLDALAPLGTTWEKPFLETAPVLIVVFQELYGLDAEGNREKNYYVLESVGIACGFLIAGLHQAGYATLTHTPSPMGFLREILKRPVNEKAAMIIVTGLPAPDAMVPVLTKKPLSVIASRV